MAGSVGAAGAAGAAGSSGSAGDAGASAGPCVPDESAPVPPRDSVRTWIAVEPEGAVCGDGSQFRFFVNYSDKSNNLAVTFEPGGACWSWDSCSGNGGLRGAANPNGLAEEIDIRWTFLPQHREEDFNPIRDWNWVFIPYCTGDLHIGNNVITYPNPDPSGEDLEFHHQGFPNTQKVIAWLDEQFPVIPKLLATGCSAGGAGALNNYHFLRQGLTGAQCGYLYNDSGPVYPSAGNSAPLHQRVRESWNIDPLIDLVAADFPDIGVDDLKGDLGLINTTLADFYPQDRLSITLYTLDFNYSLYSYESFYDFPPQADLHRLWREDIDLLVQQYDSRDNLGYFLPYYRDDNCSHCTTIPPVDSDISVIFGAPWTGSEIQESGIDARGYLEHLLDDEQPLTSYREGDVPGEGLSAERAAQCQGL